MIVNKYAGLKLYTVRPTIETKMLMLLNDGIYRSANICHNYKFSKQNESISIAIYLLDFDACVPHQTRKFSNENKWPNLLITKLN